MRWALVRKSTPTRREDCHLNLCQCWTETGSVLSSNSHGTQDRFFCCSTEAALLSSREPVSCSSSQPHIYPAGGLNWATNNNSNHRTSCAAQAEENSEQLTAGAHRDSAPHPPPSNASLFTPVEASGVVRSMTTHSSG